MTRNARALTVSLPVLALAVIAGCALNAPPPKTGLERIEHVVVIYAENRSFDHLFGAFPGADGLADATAEQMTQIDRDGKPMPELPPAWKGRGPDPAFPHRMPNKPFQLDAPPLNLPHSQQVRSPVHKYYQNIEQINGGRNNRFAEVSDAGGYVMGYYDGRKLRMWQLAQEYTLADHFFMGAFGGSYLNHLWLVCACTPRDENVPAALRAQVDERGFLKRRPDSPASALQGDQLTFDGDFTPDGYSVNTTPPPFQPSGVPPAKGGDPLRTDRAKYALPPQLLPTIGDRLSAKGVSWAWYAGGWDAAVADGMQPPEAKRTVIYNREKGSIVFQAHHQPFNYFARYAPGTAERATHLKDYKDLVAAIDKGTLPQVAFYKPQGSLNQHPGYTDVESGDRHVAELIARIKASPLWSSTAIIVTYDENGGFWDHVPPPAGDRWGPGSRIPAIIVSPYARKGYVDHTYYDTTSIIKFITRRFALEPLPGVRPAAGDLTGAFELAP
ncbi:MAG: acid phosphatase [Burkholderiales bacterium]